MNKEKVMTQKNTTKKSPKSKLKPTTKKTKKTNREEAMYLYEKGLVSAKTVLEAYDFDADQEIAKKKTDNVQIHPGLGGPRQESSMMIKSNRIEQARRNVEALTRMREWGADLKNIITDSMKKNIEVMNEVTDLK